MPALVFFVICIFILPGYVGVARAESTYELRQKQSLFVFEDFQHWIDLKYDFSDHNSTLSKAGSSSHAFQESYNAALSAAVIDPHVFNSNLRVGILFDQDQHKSETSSSSANQLNFQYNFSGSGLDKSPTPFSLLSFRDIFTTENSFSSPTTNDNTGNEFDLLLRNTLLISKFHFARNSIDTTGGGFTSSSVSNSYSYSAEHNYKDLSSTSLGVALSDQTGNGQKSAAGLLSFSNALTMGPEQQYSLVTSFQLNNTIIDNLPQRVMTFGETFTSQLGKALSLNAIYTWNNSRSSSVSGQVQESTQNQGEVTLKHKLFKSLETSLRGKVSFDRMLDGTENRYDVMGSIRYIKLLPADSQLSIAASKEYELVERRVISTTTNIIDEQHLAAHQGDFIVLPIGNGTLIRVDSVKNATSLFTYVEGVDYTVNLALGRITILSGVGVRIDPDGRGTDLFISYSVFKDPVATYVNNTLSFSTDLNLLAGKYQLGASYSEQQQNLISGPVSNSLQGSRMMMLYASGHHDIFNYNLTYRDALTGGQAYRSVEASCDASWETGESLVAFTTRDLFSMYGAYRTSAAYKENTFEATASYIRNVMSNMRLNVQGNLIDTRSDVKGPKDSLSLKVGYLILLNKVTVTMTGHTVWSLINGGTTRDDSVHIDITRYF